MGLFVRSASRMNPLPKSTSEYRSFHSFAVPRAPSGKTSSSRSDSSKRCACSGKPVSCPQRAVHTDANGRRLMNFSAMPWARRGGSISRKQEAITIAASIAIPPE